jgi:hypothetical protein
MAMFTARVELHGATEAHYERLHTAMAGIGFQRIIQGDDGRRFCLPTGVYNHPNSPLSRTEAEQRVYNVALAVQPVLSPPKTPWVILTEGNSQWHLQPV